MPFRLFKSIVRIYGVCVCVWVGGDGDSCVLSSAGESSKNDSCSETDKLSKQHIISLVNLEFLRLIV